MALPLFLTAGKLCHLTHRFAYFCVGMTRILLLTTSKLRHLTHCPASLRVGMLLSLFLTAGKFHSLRHGHAGVRMNMALPLLLTAGKLSCLTHSLAVLRMDMARILLLTADQRFLFYIAAVRMLMHYRAGHFLRAVPCGILLLRVVPRRTNALGSIPGQISRSGGAFLRVIPFRQDSCRISLSRRAPLRASLFGSNFRRSSLLGTALRRDALLRIRLAQATRRLFRILISAYKSLPVAVLQVNMLLHAAVGILHQRLRRLRQDIRCRKHDDSGQRRHNRPLPSPPALFPQKFFHFLKIRRIHPNTSRPAATRLLSLSSELCV